MVSDFCIRPPLYHVTHADQPGLLSLPVGAESGSVGGFAGRAPGGWSIEAVWAAAGSAMETVQLRNPPRRQLKKLDEDSLTKQPEEVFDVLEKLGEGSYGSVYKAIHKETGQIVAIKQVPVESDLQEIIKEISIMQQCDR